MNPDPLDRLFRSASRAPQLSGCSMPPGFENRLIAILREPVSEPSPWVGLRPVFRMAFLAAVTILVAAVGLGFHELQSERLEELSLDSRVISDSSVTLALLH